MQRNALAGRRFASWDQLNAWLREWALTVADQRIHGTTHERPADRFARETLIPLGSHRVYTTERVRQRVVSTDAMVQIQGSRYSVPVAYVGRTVTIRALLGAYEVLADGVVIARHAARGRGAVVMEPAHYAGLLRVGRGAAVPGPPRFDPAYPASADVTVRDLGVYAALVEEGVA